eukprot:CFRG6864T1
MSRNSHENKMNQTMSLPPSLDLLPKNEQSPVQSPSDTSARPDITCPLSFNLSCPLSRQNHLRVNTIAHSTTSLCSSRHRTFTKRNVAPTFLSSVQQNAVEMSSYDQTPPACKSVARREVFVKKISKTASFGADLIKIDNEYFVAKVYEVTDYQGEKTGAYRIGLSFGDRIVSVNKQAASGFTDLQVFLDTTEATLVEFVPQPWFVSTRVKLINNKLEDLVLCGRSVEKIVRGSVADQDGVQKGFALVSIDGESVLGESNAVVDYVCNQYLHSKQAHLTLMFTRESAWMTLTEGIQLILADKQKHSSVAKYVSHSLHMDRGLKDPTRIQRVELKKHSPERTRNLRRFLRLTGM